MKFCLTILGCNSATPAFNRFPTSQVLQVDQQLYLIDCGEGAQIRMSQYSIRKSKINQIFISHLHGDHIFGLVGFLTSLSMAGRKKAMDIFSPKGLQEMIEVQIRNSSSYLSFDLNFQEVDTTLSKVIFEDNLIEVTTIPLIHRIPTAGFLFREKASPLNILPDQITKFEIPVQSILAIKRGEDYKLADGTVIANKDLVLPPTKRRSYAYCSDTVYTESILPIIDKVDLLYHETTYLHEKVERAVFTKHTTALQAATLARDAMVGQLITGHYSSRYEDVTPLIQEAQTVFLNTVAGMDGVCYEVPQEREEQLSAVKKQINKPDNDGVA